MTVHPAGCDCGAYACRLRAKGVQVSPQATPTSSNKSTTRPREHQYNSWEKGIATEKRAGGREMPILDREGQVIPIKKFTEQRHQYEENRRRRAASTE